jgi:PAS domain S-box-containing protein
MFHQNKNIFDILFEVIPEGAIIVDEKQIIIASNSSVEHMFDYKKDQLINQSTTILIPLRYQEKYQKHFRYFLENNRINKKTNGVSLYGITKNKKEFPVEISLNPFNLNNKTYAIALIIDVSIRKETEKKIEMINSLLERQINKRTIELNNTIHQLKQVNLNYKDEIVKRVEAENKIKDALKKEKELNELKTKFLSLVSHEFKTPLSGILTSTMLLNKYHLTSQQNKRDKHIKTIDNKVHYLNNILNDFLSIERLDSSNTNYKFTTFNLSKIISEVVYNANMLLKPGQKISIPKNITDYILHHDEMILELILSNLIYNAIKYSPEHTEIIIKVNKRKETIIFKIIDQGIGIPENDQKFIFSRYFRAENVLNTQGTGIGLNIVKEHLENLGGSISFTSKEHKGSTFTVKIPLNKKL